MPFCASELYTVQFSVTIFYVLRGISEFSLYFSIIYFSRAVEIKEPILMDVVSVAERNCTFRLGYHFVYGLFPPFGLKVTYFSQSFCLK